MEKNEPSRNPGTLLSITVDRNGYRIHTLIDDTDLPIRTNRGPVRRDPMVQALFGAGSATRPKKCDKTRRDPKL